jgi:hypothetical protein
LARRKAEVTSDRKQWAQTTTNRADKNWEVKVAYSKKTKKKKHSRRSPLAFFAGEAFGARKKNGKGIP